MGDILDSQTLSGTSHIPIEREIDFSEHKRKPCKCQDAALRVHAKLDERFALSDSIRVVELENENSHTTLWRERHDPCAFQAEVIAPLMIAWMKERGKLAGVWIKRT